MSFRASYREAIHWIAHNDEPCLGDYDLDEIASQISVILVADLWRKDPIQVAAQVIGRRKRDGLIIVGERA